MDKHISWLASEERELEKRVLGEYSSEEVRRHLEYLATLTRTAGSDDELKAARYIKGKLDAYGIEGTICEVDDAYISFPVKAELAVLAPVQKSLPCLTHAFAASTPPGGIEAELVSLGKGFAQDYQGVDVRGKVVLVEPGGGEAQVEASEIAENKGAAAQIHISVGHPQAISINRFGRTWGNPNIETINKVPKTPAISVGNDDGHYLVELTKKGRVVVRLSTDVWQGYKTIRFPLGKLLGTKEPEKYVLFATHYCSWFHGATDNATANAMMLEMARLFSKYRNRLGRSVRFAWWSGHSHGRAAGSTWYLENFWDDLRDHAIAYVDTDAIGRMGTSGFSTRNTEEIRAFHEKVIKDVLGLEKKSNRITKIGDQSFWGLGIPSFAGATTWDSAAGTAFSRPWYGHTKEDTLDKVDRELIKIPFQVIATSILRLCNNPVLPFDFTTLTDLLKSGLHDLLTVNTSTVDLTPLTASVDSLERNLKMLHRLIAEKLSTYKDTGAGTGVEVSFREINVCLMELSRILLPVLATEAGKYGQDLWGSKFKPIPRLQPLKRLVLLDADSDEYKALRTSLVMERNRVSDALDLANRRVGHLLNHFPNEGIDHTPEKEISFTS